LPISLRAAAALVLSSLAFAAAPAGAAVPGVNLKDEPTANPAELDHLRDAGVKVIRVFVQLNDLRADPKRIDGYANDAALAQAHGMSIILVILDQDGPPTTTAAVSQYAQTLGSLAAKVRGKNSDVAYEIWNEEDAAEFWPAPDPAQYVRLLSSASSAVRNNDAAAKVVLGPTTGNNYGWIDQLYANGLTNAMFDAVAVHTDTACLTVGPDSFYRDNGRLGQFTFLGYREVRQTLLAHGADKPIWMTELGWSSTQGSSQPLCAKGAFAGQKPSGVTEDQQATFLRAAYHCLALDPYVPVALWFTYKDDPAAQTDDLRHYGLLRADGSAKPAWAAFQDVAKAPNADLFPGTPCGDFDPPAITALAPAPGQQFVGSLLIRASATDGGGSGLGRITFRVDGRSQEIRNYTGSAVADGKPVELDWQGAKKLALGKHTIAVEAIDMNGNFASQKIEVQKVKTLKATMPTSTRAYSVKCRGRKCVLRGKVSGPAGYSVGGKVQALWQQQRSVRKKGAHKARIMWKTIHKGLKNANQPFTFTQRVSRSGKWRVQVRYLGQAPLKPSSARALFVRVK
jgi:hypothetical protein